MDPEVNGGNAALPGALPTTPVQTVVGDMQELEAKLAQSETAYKGMQRNYNSLYAETAKKDAALAQMQEQLNLLMSERERLANSATSLEGTTKQLSSEQESLKAQTESVRREAEMYKIVATEFPELGPILGTLGVTPKETPEATKEMLGALSGLIKNQVAAIAKAQVGAYNSGPAGNSAPDMSVEGLRKRAFDSAGTPDYEKNAKAYYAAIQSSGEFPKPKMGPLDELIYQRG